MQTKIQIATWAGVMAGALLLAGTASAQSNCSGQPAFFTCSLSSGVTACTVASAITEFTTDVLLDAAQGCDTGITESTTLVITAAGGSGGRGADVWPADGGGGGAGGAARLGTTVADLDSTYGSPPGTTYCYGLGATGGHGDTHSASGGASTLLRTCQNVSQTATTGVLLVAGGGGGGGAAAPLESGAVGAVGGIALSTTAGPCPPIASCGGGTDSVGKQGGGFGGGGGFNGVGGAGDKNGGNAGADGIGGLGGPEEDTGTPGFIQGDPMVSGGSGQGGGNEGGGGGGGYGGGGSGYTPPDGQVTGGGGGGSYAAKSSVAISGVPGDNSGNGYLEFAFHP